MNLFYPDAGALTLAGWVRTAMAASKMRLFQSSYTPSQSTTQADLVAAEATYEGYAAKAITTWLAPYSDPGGGVSIQSGTQMFQYVDASPHTSNLVGGAWIEDTGANLLAVLVFDSPVSMANNLDAIPIDWVLNYGRTG